MARNSEKAQAMLNRWVQARKDEVSGVRKKRPFLATECNDKYEAEKWRKQIIRQIAREVATIQNGSLGEHKVRDINDQINKLFREKKHWERQIKNLGGTDYTASAPKVTDGDGSRAIGSDGYYYFGAARELPGVRELFETHTAKKNKKSRYDLYQLVDADYYGYRDDDDGLLEKLEKEQEEILIRKAEAEWKEQQRQDKKRRLEALGMTDDGDSDSEGEKGDNNDMLMKAHVELPSSEDIQKQLLEQKKKAVLAKYASMQ